MIEFLDRRIKTKRCSMCKRDLPAAMFSRNTVAKDNLRSNCKDCARESRSAWHAKNPRPGLTARRREPIRAFIQAAKAEPCVDCGRRFHFSLMEFDHTGDDKAESVSWVATKTLSIDKVAAEIAKCDLVCVICHKVRTWNRQHPDEQITGQPL